MSSYKSEDALKQIKRLTKEIAHHSRLYHQLDKPEISDEAYDSLVLERNMLLEQFPELSKKIKKDEGVGFRSLRVFKKIKHEFLQWSYSNAFDLNDITKWIERCEKKVNKKLEYVCEEKIDGLKVIIKYEQGELVYAATRGDGVIGEDITDNIKTIKSIPHTIDKNISLIIVGECYMSRTSFDKLNEERKNNNEFLFANPRNAAAGSLRQLDPTITESRDLSAFFYEIDLLEINKEKHSISTQEEVLSILKSYNIPINNHQQKVKDAQEIEEYKNYVIKNRHTYTYDIDGIVVKVNDRIIQNKLGYTSKYPHFGIAYKLPAEEAQTVIEDIVLQLGRTGVVTPVAILQPVRIAGSLVRRATLHNADEIERLDIRIGDRVIIEKAGDIIPKVKYVMKTFRDGTQLPYIFPQFCSLCGGNGSLERIPGNVAYRCVYKGSFTESLRKWEWFVSKSCFDIRHLGPKLIELLLQSGLLIKRGDIFRLKKEDLLMLPRLEEKSVNRLLESIQSARTISLSRFITSLGIENVGKETAELLVEKKGTLDTIVRSTEEELASIHGIGQKIAHSIVTWFTHKDNYNEVVDLLECVTITISPEKEYILESVFKNKKVVLTGSLDKFSRDEAIKEIKRRGGIISQSVSKSTDYVIFGNDPGSKLKKAHELGINTMDENQFYFELESSTFSRNDKDIKSDPEK